MMARLKQWAALHEPAPVDPLDAPLAARKRIRLIESARVKQGQLAAQRARWAQDPLRQA